MSGDAHWFPYDRAAARRRLEASREGPHMHLQRGDACSTRYADGRLTHHTVTERLEGQHSQTGVMYRVTPYVPKSSGGPLDAAWFATPVEPQARLFDQEGG